MRPKLMFIVALFVFASFTLTEAQESCPVINGISTRCMVIDQCKFAVEGLSNLGTKRDTIRQLRRLHCGFRGFTTLVCCSQYLTLDILMDTNRFTPTTSKPRIPDATSTTTSTTTTTTTTTTMSPIIPTQSLLPSLEDCGSDSSANKIYDGERTDIDELPWMALFGYRRETNEISFECGGSVINDRYILTAAHCVTGRILNVVGPLEFIRLGEYDKRTDIDCLQAGQDRDCAPAHQDIGIEQTIPHPGYKDGNTNRKDDIALIRLSRKIDFSYFIQPICLPTTDILAEPQAKNGDKDLLVAGWGYTLEGRKSDVKLKLSIPRFDKDKCDTMFFNTFKANLTERQICAGGEYAKDSCNGDSGGPLMIYNKENWYAVGIISFGYNCGRDGWPAFYTNTLPYMDWIRSNLRP